jgi:DDE superfamily endonuclease/Helix-turn-helix of DDE superfamily endonuclease
MIRFAQLKKKPNTLKSLTGLTVEGFEALLPAFKGAYEADLEQRDRQRSVPRQRERGAGQKGALPELDDKLVFILFYFRVYPVQIVQGFLFGMGQPQANEWIKRLSPVLKRALGYDRQLPARAPADIKAVLERCPGLEFIIDGSERPIRRPQDKERQKANYSGKKKRHTCKNNLITDKRTGKIKGLSPTVEGKHHDKKIADEQGEIFPAGSSLWKDTGFQGYEPKAVHSLQPKKKPKGRDLSEEEKAANRLISKDRIGIEHSLAGIKVFRIVHDVYRNMRQDFDDLVMEIACGLHNFRLDHPLAA